MRRLVFCILKLSDFLNDEYLKAIMTDRLIADFEIQIEDFDFELLKNALEKFELDVASNKIVSFFDNNLTTDEKHLVAFTMRKIVTAAFECIKRNSIADDE